MIVSFADGTTRRLTPALLSGRGYIALAVPHGARLVRLISYDAAGHPFASTTSLPPAK